MNWYNIFYWVTVADGVKDFFDWFSNFFSVIAIISGIILAIFVAGIGIGSASDGVDGFENDSENRYWLNFWRKTFIWFTILACITWAGYVFTPSKKDALIIIAGGSVGQFITSDSSAKQIPSEITNLLKNKIKELNEYSIVGNKDTLSNLTKEELINIIKSK
jgi:hypothetical protein